MSNKRIWTDDQTAQALKYDPLVQAEKLTGKSYKEDGSTGLLGLALAMRSHDAETRMLKDAADTHGEMSLAEYCGVVERIGFRNVLTVPFQGKDYADELQIWWHDARGLLLVFDTFWNKKSVNGGHVYYNWRPSAGCNRYDLTSSGSTTKDGVWYGDHDCRKALRINMDRLAANGEFIVPWVAWPRPWLCHYADLLRDNNRWRENDEIHKRVTAERLAMLPDDVRNAICCPLAPR